MKTFETHFKNLTRGIEDHQFKHYNNAMGCMIYGKEHYKKELRQRGMVPFEMAEELSDRYEKDHKRKEYELSPKARKLINFFKEKCLENGGYIRMGDYPKAVRELKNMGMDFERDLNKYMEN